MSLPAAYERYEADYRTVVLAGTPEAIGRQQAGYLALAASPFRRNPWERDQAFLAGCAEALLRLSPELWAEVAAFATAQGLPPEQGLFVRGGSLRHGCSSVAWRAADGRVLAGRNYDFYHRMPTRHLLHTRPERGFGHIGMNGGLVGGRYDGVNERGVFVALHKVMATAPAETRPGIPFHLLVRLVLERCADGQQAAELIAGVGHLAPFNYSVADAQGNLFALECYPGQRVRVRRAELVVAVANHYHSEALAPLQGRRPTDGSRARVARLRSVVGTEADPWVATAAALCDHEAAVCAHREFGATLWSGLFDLSEQRVSYAFGPPCTTPFVAQPWPEAPKS